MAGNLLATGAILIVGLTIGRETIQAWYAEPNQPPVVQDASPELKLGQLDLLHNLQFGGQSQAISYRNISGDAKSALAILRQNTRQVIEVSEPSDEPGPAETRWLKNIEELEPIEEKANDWQMFEIKGPVPLVVGVRNVNEKPVVGPKPNDVQSTRRVVCWSIGIPSTDQANPTIPRWALFTCGTNKTPIAKSPNESTFQNIPLPLGSRQTMSIGGPASGAIIGFAGTGNAQEWKRHFDHSAHSHDWTTVADWRSEEKGWHKRFRNHDDATIDVTFSLQSDHNLRGLIIVTP